MDKDIEKIKEKFYEYIIGIHRDDLIEILSNYDPLLYYPVFIDLLDLLMPTEIQDFLTNASSYINLLDQSLKKCQKILIEENPDLKLILKEKIKARLVSLPEADGVFIKYPSCSDVNKLISFNGTVTKTCSPRLLESIQNFKCDKCSFIFGVDIDYTYRELFMKPSQCPSKDCQSDEVKLVNPESFKFLNQSELQIDNECWKIFRN